ncbi:MAG: glycosyltransferase [Chitinophagaceae bacterium]|nr:MAG: glycosyltransferase [Chitinophagaceae bacterium]
MAKVIIIGSAYPLRGGGLTTFNHRLAKAFMDHGDDCSIWSFSLQYPNFLFPGKSQYAYDEPPPKDISIKTIINSINPLNWIKVGLQLKKEKPDIVVVRYWLPFMGPCLGTILRFIKRNKHTKIICIADNIVPHEKRIGDTIFTKYFVKSCHAFVTMSEAVLQDLRKFSSLPAQLVHHPLYDNFGEKISKQEARKNLNITPNDAVVLFFGFIRKYKGLDILLEAFAKIKDSIPHIKLLIAGEFYEDENSYQQKIDMLKLREQVILHTHFIADHEVKNYLCAADVLVQPYKNATQSGVTPLAYHFEKPMIVTNVGGLPALVPHEKCGLVTSPDANAIANALEKFYALGEQHFIPFIQEEKQKYSWENIITAIQELSK